MNETPDLPQHAVEAEFGEVAGRSVIALERYFPYGPQTVWIAVVRASELARWAPFEPDHDLDATGPVSLPLVGGDGAVSHGEVLEADAPHLVVFTWDSDELRFEIAEAGSGVRFRLVQVFNDRDSAASYAAGWHLCLAALQALLEGSVVPQVAGDAAHIHGWDELHEQYSELFAAEH